MNTVVNVGWLYGGYDYHLSISSGQEKLDLFDRAIRDSKERRDQLMAQARDIEQNHPNLLHHENWRENHRTLLSMESHANNDLRVFRKKKAEYQKELKVLKKREHQLRMRAEKTKIRRRLRNGICSCIWEYGY